MTMTTPSPGSAHSRAQCAVVQDVLKAETREVDASCDADHDTQRQTPLGVGDHDDRISVTDTASQALDDDDRVHPSATWIALEEHRGHVG